MSTEEKPLVNRVANSGLITFNLEEYYPIEEMVEIDLMPFLFQGLILKEKDFRASLKEVEWAKYQDKICLVYCSVDAIIPVWAYMLISTKLESIAKDIFHGQKDAYLSYYYKQLINEIDVANFEGQRVVIKGCSHKPVPTSAYMDLAARIKSNTQSIMYGEPCSTVPIFKRPRKLK